MEPAFRPRRDDHLVEPLFDGLGASPESDRRLRWGHLTVGVTLLVLAAVLWWLAR